MRWLSCFCFLLCLCQTFNVKASAPLRFVTSQYEPYVIESTFKPLGLMPELLNAIYEDQAIEIDLVPWKRAEFMLDTGEAFAAFPYGIGESRIQQYWFSDPLLDFGPKLFYLKENFPKGFIWNSVDDLKSYRIVAVNGYHLNSIYEERHLSVHYVSEETQAMQMILGNRADFTIIDGRVGWHLLQALNPKNADFVTTSGTGDFVGTYYLMVSRHYPDAKKHLEYFNNRLKAIKMSGEYDRILNSYKQ